MGISLTTNKDFVWAEYRTWLLVPMLYRPLQNLASLQSRPKQIKNLSPPPHISTMKKKVHFGLRMNHH